MKQIKTIDQFEELCKEGEHFFFLKHSLTCPISQAAYEAYQRFSTEASDIAFYYLTVQESRPLSNYIAEKYHIKHESPQAFLFINEVPAWNASHWKITNEALKNALEGSEKKG
ncbi:bacillithiol system redox-active protein YtxJ [Cytobacillus sp. Hz8]|uniref:bacillithiol system redox-active protein YtxJ n=1 Tax=Cytobacillus sp. Hz8 TaxID=3347168 RepID=UPI0035D71AF2